MNEIKEAVKCCAMRNYYVKRRKILALQSGCKYVCKSFFNINMLLNLCLQHSFKEKEDFKGTPIGDTVWEIYSFNCSNNFAIAAPLFSLAVTVTPLICFQ